MKFIDPGFEELKYDNPLLLGERCTRVCYKSEDKISEGSAKKLLNGIIKTGHAAMIEHISVYMKISEKQFNEITDPENPIIKIVFSPYTKYVICEGELYISTNLRVLYDADRNMVNEYMENEGNRFMFTCGLSNYKFEDYADYFYRRVTILFTMDRIGSQSFCRHRTLSFAQESTRWCNYVRAKFGSEISIITPCWLKEDDLSEYEEDMIKYADDADKVRIRECFESIPKQLAKDNKKFQYSVVRKGGRSSQYVSSIQWLEDAGLVKRCYNTQITELPLEGNSIKECFKLYTTDIGLLVAMLDYGTQADILKGNLLGYKGAIFENLMADFLCKSGQKLYYFQKESGLELDFLVRYNGECVALEIKAKSGKTKSLKTALKNKNVYHLNNAIKLGQYNVGREEEILTIPLYMGFLIQDRLTDVIVPDIDLTLLD